MNSKDNITLRYHNFTPEKNKVILYSSENQIKESIFDEILSFKLNISPKAKSISKAHTERGIDSKTTLKERFAIPEEKIGDIIRTKYLQGWEQIYKEQTV